MPKYSCSVEHYTAHVELHRQWSAAVGQPFYDKKQWNARSNALHARCSGGCLANPPPLPEEQSGPHIEEHW